MTRPNEDPQSRLNDVQTYLVREFVQEYKDGHMARRDMVRRVLYIAGGVASTASLLSSLGCQPAASSPTPAAKPTGAPAPAPAAPPSPATVPSPISSPSPSPSPATAAAPSGPQSPLSVAANDPAIQASGVTFPGSDGATIRAYQARPAAGSGPFPVVLLCHENRGVTPHFEDVARRYAKEGYLALAIDLVSREGGTSGVADPTQIPAILSASQNIPRHVEDFKSAVEYVKSQGSLAKADRIGMNGFCFGGIITWRAATAIPDLKAAVPFYGAPPPLDQVPNIKAAVFGVYSSDSSDSANNGREQLEAALKAAGVTYEMKVYPNTRHAFFNDTDPNRWNPEQGPIAFHDTLAWFQRYLKA